MISLYFLSQCLLMYQGVNASQTDCLESTLEQNIICMCAQEDKIFCAKLKDAFWQNSKIQFFTRLRGILCSIYSYASVHK